MKWLCLLGCGDQESRDIEQTVEHLRVMHPEQYGDGPERWPDGSLVVYDQTLEPEEFNGCNGPA